MALSAAVPARAQTPPPGQAPAAAQAPAPPQTPPATRRPHAGIERCAARPAGNHLRADRAAAGQAAAGQFPAGAVPDHAVLREAGRLPGHRGEHLPVLHRAEGPGEPAVGGSLDAVRRRDRTDDRRRLQAAVGHELPRRPGRGGPRRPLLERRDRQGRGLQHGGAPAGQDRRLRRHPQGRPVEDRREAEREAAPDPARLVHRSRPAAARRRRRARSLRSEGLPVRRGQAGGQGGRGRSEAGERHLPHQRGPEGPHPRDRVRREQGGQRRLAAAADEGEQGRAASSRSSSRAAPTRKRSSKTTPRTSSTTTAIAATSARRSASRS